MSGDTSQALLDKVCAAILPVGGICAVVLGGSRGRGAHTAASDYDIGIYYDGPLDVAALERVAQSLNTPVAGRSYLTGATDRRPPTQSAAPLVTPIGGWGPWVNGGGWLTIDGAPVDFIYRDAARVERVIAEAREGRFECAYHYGHPHGFVSTIYAGEVATCRVLADPRGFLAAAKAKLTPYPEPLRAATMARFLDEARFFLAISQKAAAQGDVTFVSGNLFRAQACLMQVLFAINRQWLLNEKGSLRLAESFVAKPRDLKTRMERAFTLSPDAAVLKASLEALSGLVEEAAALA
ncbi:MAG: nucleotidyltransferase domain-containing protein [Alphaproteobacteria bacterium]|nr:nucleotidyltransferase domain-containing protein [Alphaproteobacteria bacterium]